MQAYTVTVENRSLDQSYPSSSLLGSNNSMSMQDHQLNGGNNSSNLPQQVLHTSDANYYQNPTSQQDLHQIPPPPPPQQFHYQQQQQMQLDQFQHQQLHHHHHQQQHQQQNSYVNQQFSIPPSVYNAPRPRSKSAISTTTKVDTHNDFEEPETPKKRKRGRPPKPSSLTNQITTTLNISVNTSPLNTSPMAESNSLSSARRGVPDFFTPLMRVSPSSRTKKKRKNSSSSTTTTPTLLKKHKSTSNLSDSVRSASTGNILENVLITPLSSVNGSAYNNYHQINSKTLDNLSMITQSNSNVGESLPYYNTPPSSTVKSQFPNYLAPSNSGSANAASTSSSNNHSTNQVAVDFMNQSNLAPAPKRQVNESIEQDSTAAYLIRSHGSPPLPSSSEDNLLPAVSLIPGSNKNNDGKISPKTIESNVDDSKPVDSHSKSSSSSSSTNDFSLKLFIDDSGKAVLSTDFLSNSPSTTTSTTEIKKEETEVVAQPKVKKTRGRKSVVVKDDEVNSVNDNGDQIDPTSSKQSFNEILKPKLTHVNSVIGIEAQYAQSSGLSPPLTMGNNDSAEFQQSRPNLLRRHNSDFIGVAASSILNQNTSLSSINENGNLSMTSAPSVLTQLPQTPNYKENYLYSTTGLTPNSNLTFNLTPQFNSMMYSMMNINSPQQKKASGGVMSNQQFLISQEFYQSDSLENHSQNTSITQDQSLQNEYVDQTNSQGKTIDMNDLLSMRDNTNTSTSLVEKPNVSQGVITEMTSSSGSSSNEDSGDARLALKKIIHIKRK